MYWHFPLPVLPALPTLPVIPFVTTLALPPSSRTDPQRPKHHNRSPENNPSTGTAISSTSLGGIQVTTTVTLTYSSRDETEFPYPILRFPVSGSSLGLPPTPSNCNHSLNSSATRSWTTRRNLGISTSHHLASSVSEHDNNPSLSHWPTNTTISTSPITQHTDSEYSHYPPPPTLLDPGFTPRSCAWRYYQLLLLSPQHDQSLGISSSSSANSEFPFPAACRTNSLSHREWIMGLIIGVIAILGRWGRILVLRLVLWEMERSWMEWGVRERVEEV